MGVAENPLREGGLIVGSPRRQNDQGTVAPQPQVTPQPITPGSSDHSFTLQAIIGLEKSVAEIGVHIQGMRSSIDGLKTKVDDLVGWKNKIIGGVAVFGIVFTAVGYLAAKASDYVTIRVPTALQVTPVVAPLPSPAAVAPPTAAPATKP